MVEGSEARHRRLVCHGGEPQGEKEEEARDQEGLTKAGKSYSWERNMSDLPKCHMISLWERQQHLNSLVRLPRRGWIILESLWWWLLTLHNHSYQGGFIGKRVWDVEGEIISICRKRKWSRQHCSLPRKADITHPVLSIQCTYSYNNICVVFFSNSNVTGSQCFIYYVSLYRLFFYGHNFFCQLSVEYWIFQYFAANECLLPLIISEPHVSVYTPNHVFLVQSFSPDESVCIR